MTTAIGYRNLADAATITATDEQSTTPVGNLKVEHISTKWRTASGKTGTAIVVDFGSTTAINYVGLLGLNLTAADTIGVKGSTINGDGDSNVFSDQGMTIDPVYGDFHHHRALVSVRWLRFSIAITGAPAAIEAGRLLAMNCFRPTHGIQFGFRRVGHVTADGDVSDGGQDWTRIKHTRRGFDATYRAVTTAEIDSQWESIRTYGGLSRDMLLCTNIASAAPGRDNVWGPCIALDGPIHTDPGLWRLSLELRQRL